jgi:hypothetical protein
MLLALVIQEVMAREGAAVTLSLQTTHPRMMEVLRHSFYQRTSVINDYILSSICFTHSNVYTACTYNLYIQCVSTLCIYKLYVQVIHNTSVLKNVYFPPLHRHAYLT